MNRIFVNKLICFSFLCISFFEANAQQKNVLIAYYSSGGRTKDMAEAVRKGVASKGHLNIKLLPVKEVMINDLLKADAIIIGSPVQNANPAPEVLEFIRKWPFEGQPFKDKLGAVFVTAGGFSAGEELVQTSLLQAMLIYGMIVVGGPDWKSAFGASAIHDEDKYMSKQPDPYFLEKGFKLGERVAELVQRFH